MSFSFRSKYAKSTSIALMFCFIFAMEAPAFSQANQPQVQSEIQHSGGAEVRAITRRSFDPSHQPPIYWHDDDWKIDLITPTPEQGGGTIEIKSNKSAAKIVKLPQTVAQVDSIALGPGDKAIVIDEISGSGLMSFLIFDLHSGELLDSVPGFNLSHSPNNRFILYINGFSPHSPFPTEDQYRLYDLLKSPRENTCGFRDNDPKHESLDDTWRGQPIYPLKKGEMFRPNESENGFKGGAHQMAGSFWWSQDSAGVLFADSQGGLLSLVLAVMPQASRDNSKTFVYPLPEVAAEAADKVSWSDIASAEWQGDSVKVTLRSAPFRGRRENKVLTVKETEFKQASR